MVDTTTARSILLSMLSHFHDVAAEFPRGVQALEVLLAVVLMKLAWRTRVEYHLHVDLEALFVFNVSIIMPVEALPGGADALIDRHAYLQICVNIQLFESFYYTGKFWYRYIFSCDLRLLLCVFLIRFQSCIPVGIYLLNLINESSNIQVTRLLNLR